MNYWPAVARGDEEAPSAMCAWVVKLKAKPKYVVSSTRKACPWTNSHNITGDLRTVAQKLKHATPARVLRGSGRLATELDRLDLRLVDDSETIRTRRFGILVGSCKIPWIRRWSATTSYSAPGLHWPDSLRR